MNTSLKIAIGSFFAAAAVIKGAPALAEPAQPQNVSIVRTADLDLSSENGRRQLDQRLIGAARDVCGTASDVDLEGKNEVRACRSEVLDKARSHGEQLASRGGPILVAAGR
jgi:UrcA family protein